jgi:hypothetical protein
MSLWGKIDQANNAPKYRVTDVVPQTGVQAFGTGVVGLDAGEVASGNATHAGWNRVVRGTGGVASFAITAPGTLYANTNTINVTGGTVNATATIQTNGSGVVQSITVTNPGAGFTNTASAVATVTTATGTGLTFTVQLGGRANRIFTETLVAMGSMTANGSSLAF